MDKIIEIITVSLLLFFLCVLCRYIYKRAFAIGKIKTLQAVSSAKITKARPGFASYFKLTESADLIVEVGRCIYFIRFLNGKGAHRFMHFASPEFFVTYSKMRFSVGSLTSIRGRRAMAKSPGFITTGAHSVKILPPLKIPDEYIKERDVYEKELVPVLILNPAPNEVSYVTENKTSIKVAFTGDEIYGQKVFTATSFVSYAERTKRAERYYKG